MYKINWFAVLLQFYCFFCYSENRDMEFCPTPQGFRSRGFCPGGLCHRGFCPRGFCPDTVNNIGQLPCASASVLRYSASVLASVSASGALVTTLVGTWSFTYNHDFSPYDRL